MMCAIDYGSIKLLVLDVDGVLTNGQIILAPDGQEVKAFHVRDGSGMKYWKRTGRKLAIITARSSQAVVQRAREMDVDAVRLNAKDKLPAYESVLAELGVSPGETAAVGDDLPDLPILWRCALPVAVADAVDEVKRAAAYVTRLEGGAGAVRELIELILKQAGAWEAVLARYVPPGREHA